MDIITNEVRLSHWIATIQECNNSGLSKRQWCQKNDVNEKQFYYWQRRIRNQIYDKRMHSIDASPFVELPAVKCENPPANKSENISQPETVSLKLSKGKISIELMNLSAKELLDFTKELLADA